MTGPLRSRDVASSQLGQCVGTAFETLEPRLLLSVSGLLEIGSGPESLAAIQSGFDVDIVKAYDEGIRAVEWQGGTAYVVAGEWAVGFDSDTSLATVTDALALAKPSLRRNPGGAVGPVTAAVAAIPALMRNVSVVDSLGSDSMYKLTMPFELGYDAVQEILESIPSFSFFEPNIALFSTATTPDDTHYDELWGMHNTGQSSGTADADIDAPEAWDINTGSGEAVIGVIDSGIDYSHEDLYLNVWINQDEIPSSVMANLTDVDSDGLITFYDLNDSSNYTYAPDWDSNGQRDAADLIYDDVNNDWLDDTDNDGNGFTDDLVGWDFVNDDNDPLDDGGHGSHVSGTIAGIGDNGTGVVGVNWRAQIMPLKAFGSAGTGSMNDAAAALDYATAMKVDNGVNINVTSNSYGTFYAGEGTFGTTVLASAIVDSGDEGMLFVASAGNWGMDTATMALFPAALDADNIISVAASDRNDMIASFSTYGADVDVAAPGVYIASTVPEAVMGSDYVYGSGTSMAAPHVAGLAALMWDLDPDATYDDIRDTIFDTVDPLATLADQQKVATGGRINAHSALQQTGLRVIAVTPGEQAVITTQATQFVVTLDEAVDSSTVAASDLTVNSTAADSYQLSQSDTVITFTFNTSPVSSQGPQTISIAADAFDRDRDSDGVRAYAGAFYYDTTPLVVSSTIPASDGSSGVISAGKIRVNFNEAYDSLTIGADDLVLSVGTVTAATVVDSDSVDYTVSGVYGDREIEISLDMLFGAVSDPNGSPLAAYSGTVKLDYSTHDLDFERATPYVGDFVFQDEIHASIHSGDTDAFSFWLDGDHTVTIAVIPSDGLKPSITLYNPADYEVDSQTASAADEITVLSADSEGYGNYYFEVTGASSTTGDYQLIVLINAAIETEAYGGSTNNTRVTAQSIENDFVEDVSGIDRAAVTSLPIYSESFEYVGLDSDTWSTYSSLETTPRIFVSDMFGAGDGVNGLLMDNHKVQVPLVYNLNEAVWTLDMSSVPSDLKLGFWQLDSETDREGDAEFVFGQSFEDHYNATGIAISDDTTAGDGIDWFPMWNAVEQVRGTPDEYYPWVHYTLDLGAAVTTNSMSLVDGFQIKFQQYWDFPLPTSGRGFDGIELIDASDDWYSFSLTAGQAVTIALQEDAWASGSIALYDSSDNLLTAPETDTLSGATVVTYRAGATGTYYVKAVSDDPGYFVSVTRDAALDTETNNSRSEAQDITGTDAAMGTLSRFEYHQAQTTTSNITTTTGVTFNFTDAPDPAADGILTFYADADLEWGNEFLIVEVDGEELGRIFRGLGAEKGSPSTPDTLALPMDLIEDLVDTDSTISVKLKGGEETANVNYVTVDVWYPTVDPESDYYEIEVNSGDQLVLETFTMDSSLAWAYQDLDPALQLFDPSGTSVATDDNSATDGVNAKITYTTLTTGTYSVRVHHDADTAGDYILTVDGSSRYTSETTAPTITSSTTVSPDPRNATVPSFVLTFSEPVYGVSLDQFVLYRTVDQQQSQNLLTGSNSLSQTDNGRIWTLDLGSLTATDGDYELTFDVGATPTVKDLADNAIAANTDVTETWTMDDTDPTVAITAVSPDPRNSTVSSVEIVFSEAVTGFDKDHLTLSIGASGDLLTGSQTLTTSDGGITWVLGNLSGITDTEGTWVLKLYDESGAATHIQDATGNYWLGGTSDKEVFETWVMDTTEATLAITEVSPDPRNSTVGSIELVFSEAVSGLTMSNLYLQADGGGNLLTGSQTVTTSDGGVTWTLNNLSGLTGTESDWWELIIYDEYGDITDAAGNTVDYDDDTEQYEFWVMDTTDPTVTITAVSPDPRSTAVTSITFTFSEAVTGFSLDDMDLEWDDGENYTSEVLDGQTHTLTTSNGGITWTLSDISDVTDVTGYYILTMYGTDIMDLAGNSLDYSPGTYVQEIWEKQ